MIWNSLLEPFSRQILKDAKSLAVVGASSNWKRPSFYVMKYMQAKGYRITPVNLGSSVTGSIILRTSVTFEAGKPLRSACSRMSASLSAM